MKTIKTCILLMTAVSAVAQTAKVVPLSTADAKKADALFKALAAAEAKIYAFRLEIEDRYVSDAKTGSVPVDKWAKIDLGPGRRGPDGGVTHEDPTTQRPRKIVTKPGWEWGFEFSDDYKFLVPRVPATIGACPNLPRTERTARP